MNFIYALHLATKGRQCERINQMTMAKTIFRCDFIDYVPTATDKCIGCHKCRRDVARESPKHSNESSSVAIVDSQPRRKKNPNIVYSNSKHVRRKIIGPRFSRIDFDMDGCGRALNDCQRDSWA